jgi:hypothetical protein
MSHILIDAYSDTNANSNDIISNSGGVGTSAGQSFLVTAETNLSKASMYIAKGGSPTGFVYAKLYNHTGTFGSTGIPTGNAKAVSDGINIATQVTGSNAYVDFLFPSRPLMVPNTAYFIILEFLLGDASNYLSLPKDTTSPTHAGNKAAGAAGSWGAFSTEDVIFSVYGWVPDSAIYEVRNNIKVGDGESTSSEFS